MDNINTTAATVHAVDNTDWLKAAAIVWVVVDHTGMYFVENNEWFRVFGRFAAPVFFFLIGFAHTTAVPRNWIVIGIFLTVLESWGENWEWVAPNILLSFAVLRWLRPIVHDVVLNMEYARGWNGFVGLAGVCVLAAPFTGEVLEYGTSGWLWALAGLYQRAFLDGDAKLVPLRLAALVCAASVYFFCEQSYFTLTPVQLTVFGVGLVVLSVTLFAFMRGASRVQPGALGGSVLRFTGRHTLEIYAVQLAASVIVAKLLAEML